ncbi:MAG TPA: PAS domain S-box protein [Polyangiales bacterium]
MPDGAHPASARRRAWGWSFGVLVLGLALAAVLSAMYRADRDARVRAQFERDATNLTDQLLGRIRVYEQALRGTQGLAMTAGDSLTRRRFALYAQSCNLATAFPGARGIAIVERVAPEREEAFLTSARLEQPYFMVKQLAPHQGTRWVVKYAEPERDNRESLGLDLTSEARARSALERALSTGQSSLTAPIRSVDAPTRGALSVLLLLPVYQSDVAITTRRDRENAAVGFVYVSLLMDDVLSGFELLQGPLGVSLADVTTDARAQPFVRVGVPDQRGMHASQQRELFGRTWRIELYARAPLGTADAGVSPFALFVIAALVALLLAALTLLYMLSQLRLEAARVQQRRVMALFAHTSDAILSEDLTGSILSWNLAAEQIFGFTARQVLGKTRAELGIGSSTNLERDALAKGVAGESAQPFEAVWRSADGAEVAVSVAVTALRESNGAIVGVGLTVRDTREQKAAARRLQEHSQALEKLVAERTREIDSQRDELRAALRDNQALLSTLNQHALISMTDRRGVLTHANEAFCRVSGYTREELVGKPHSVVNSGVHPREFWIEMWRTISSGRSWRREVCNRAKDGSLYYVDSIVAPLFDNEGYVDRYVSIRYDITDRHAAVLELARERERLGNILSSTRAGTWEWNVQTGEIRVNDRWARMLGYELQELDATRVETWRARVHPDDLSQVQRQLELHFAGGADTFESEYRLRHRDGSWIWAQSRGAIIARDAEGKPEWMYGTHLDVTGRHQAEEALRRATAEAEAANAAKSEFLANVSHEIRTPLNAVIGLSHLLERTQLNREQADYLSKIHSAGRHLLGVINDVLDLSKIEAGELVLEERTFELGDVLDQLKQMLTPQAAGKGIAFEICDPPSEARSLRGDATRLSQILTNLLSNAIKFTMRGTVSLSITTTRTEGGALRLRCLVRDTGVGISPEVQAKLFSPFTQADASTTRGYGGTGLGLSIVKRLCNAMNGEVGVTSTPGLGSEFCAEVELATGDPAEATGVRAVELLIALPSTQERDLILGLSRELGWRGCVITSASEFNEQLRRYATEGRAIDLLIVPEALDGQTAQALTTSMQQELAPELVPSVLVLGREVREDGLDSLYVAPGTRITASLLFDAACAAILRRYGEYDRLLRSTRLHFTSGQWLTAVRVLLADDSEINIEVARSILEREGALVTPVRDGREALAQLRGRPDGFDIVLMDVQMPGMDGNEATERIRSDLGLKSLPVVALTAGALVAQRQRALAAGVNDFLTKPLDPIALIRCVHEQVRRRRLLAANVMKPTLVAPETTVRWPAVDGIDMGLAAQRTMQSHELFRNVLERLLREYAPLAQEPLRVPSTSEERGELQQRMHKLRGSAGMLGAVQLHEAAGALEDAISDGAAGDGLRERMTTVQQAFVRVVRGAAALVANDTEPQNAGAADGALVPVLDHNALRVLRGQLAANDLDALSQFAEQRAALSAALDGAQFTALSQAVGDLRFEVALDILRELEARWERVS